MCVCNYWILHFLLCHSTTPAKANSPPCSRFWSCCWCTSAEESYEGIRYVIQKTKAHLHCCNYTKQVLQMLLLFTAYRNRWRCYHQHCCAEKQCSEARHQAGLQIPPGKGERNSGLNPPGTGNVRLNMSLFISEFITTLCVSVLRIWLRTWSLNCQRT